MDLNSLLGLSLSELDAMIEDLSNERAEVMTRARLVTAARDHVALVEQQRAYLERLKMPPEEREKVLGKIIKLNLVEAKAKVHQAG